MIRTHTFTFPAIFQCRFSLEGNSRLPLQIGVFIHDSEVMNEIAVLVNQRMPKNIQIAHTSTKYRHFRGKSSSATVVERTFPAAQ